MFFNISEPLFMGNDQHAHEWIDSFLDAKPELDPSLESEWSSEFVNKYSVGRELMPRDNLWARDYLKDEEHIEWYSS